MTTTPKSFEERLEEAALEYKDAKYPYHYSSPDYYSSVKKDFKAGADFGYAEGAKGAECRRAHYDDVWPVEERIAELEAQLVEERSEYTRKLAVSNACSRAQDQTIAALEAQLAKEREAAKGLVEALEACAPSWLPPEIRDQKREALAAYRAATAQEGDI